MSYIVTIGIYWYNIIKLYIDTRIITLFITRTHVDKLINRESVSFEIEQK